jgi:hypothetical protein
VAGLSGRAASEETVLGRWLMVSTVTPNTGARPDAAVLAGADQPGVSLAGAALAGAGAPAATTASAHTAIARRRLSAELTPRSRLGRKARDHGLVVVPPTVVL